MKAKTICPKCKQEIIEDCYGCITGNILMCLHKGTDITTEEEGIPDDFNVKWEIIEQ